MINPFKKFYSQLFKDKFFIIKAGGRIITDKAARETIVDDIKELTGNNTKILFVYGGGQSIDEAMIAAGLTPKKIEGRRITSGEDIKIVKKTLVGDLGFKISETMVKKKMPSTILNAIPPHWATAKRRIPEQGVVRFDGRLHKINGKAVRDHFSSTNLAVCPCLAFDEEGTALNINADNAAIELAVETSADKLILLTDIDGVMVDGKLKSVLSARECEKFIKDGIVTGGMQVKLENCINAVRMGVKRIHILNGFKQHALRDEVYTSEGTGTMIVREAEKAKYIVQEIEKGKWKPS